MMVVSRYQITKNNVKVLLLTNWRPNSDGKKPMPAEKAAPSLNWPIPPLSCPTPESDPACALSAAGLK